MRERRTLVAIVLLSLAWCFAFAAPGAVQNLHRDDTSVHAMIIRFDPPELIGLNGDPWSITGWEQGVGYVEIGSTYVAHTAPNAMALTGAGKTHGFVETTAYRPLPTLTVGTFYTVSAWINGDGANENTPLQFQIWNVGGRNTESPLHRSYPKSSQPPGWNRVVIGYFAADGIDPNFNTMVWLLGYPWVPQGQVQHWEIGYAEGTWLIDDIEISETDGEEMAVLLSAFGTRAAMQTMQASLNPEIVYIASETNLDIDMPQVASWRTYDSGLATPDTVEAEVFETGSTIFPHEKYDQSTWNAASPRTRVTSMTPMRAAINHANRGDASHADATLLASQMQQRSRLYGAALVRCFRNRPDLNQPSIIAVVPRSVRYSVHEAGRLDGNVRRVGRVEFDFELHMRETAIGETLPSQGLLPSVTYMELP